MVIGSGRPKLVPGTIGPKINQKLKKHSFCKLFHWKSLKKAEQAQFYQAFSSKNRQKCLRSIVFQVFFILSCGERAGGCGSPPAPLHNKKRVYEQQIRGNVVQELFRPFCDRGLLSLEKCLRHFHVGDNFIWLSGHCGFFIEPWFADPSKMGYYIRTLVELLSERFTESREYSPSH